MSQESEPNQRTPDAQSVNSDGVRFFYSDGDSGPEDLEPFDERISENNPLARPIPTQTRFGHVVATAGTVLDCSTWKYDGQETASAEEIDKQSETMDRAYRALARRAIDPGAPLPSTDFFE